MQRSLIDSSFDDTRLRFEQQYLGLLVHFDGNETTQTTTDAVMPINHLPLNHLLSSTDPSDFAKRKSLSDVSLAVAKARRVVVVSGAGISCSSGIPVS